jgi:hypothetical protein
MLLLRGVGGIQGWLRARLVPASGEDAAAAADRRFRADQQRLAKRYPGVRVLKAAGPGRELEGRPAQGFSLGFLAPSGAPARHQVWLAQGPAEVPGRELRLELCLRGLESSLARARAPVKALLGGLSWPRPLTPGGADPDPQQVFARIFGGEAPAWVRDTLERPGEADPTGGVAAPLAAMPRSAP